MSISKEITLDNSIPYDILKEALEEDAKMPKITRYYKNALGIRRVGNSLYQLIYPNHKKNEINIDEIKVERGAIKSVEPKASGAKISNMKIQQLEVFNKKWLLSRDYYSVHLSEITEEDPLSVKDIHSWTAPEDCLIQFKQSPYLANDLFILGERSKLYRCHLD